jgi:mRNA-degrading endonuclease RelE of RelBE toxin-antitoxin system
VVFVKYKINEPETNTKNKNNSDLYKEKIMWRQTYVSKYGNFRIILYIQDCGNSENLQVQPLHTPF